MISRTTLLSVVVVLTSSLVGCAGGAQGVAVETAPQRSAELQYAAALDEAFAQYETEVVRASQLDFDSADEADAVSRSLTVQRFDELLEQALGRRGTTVAALGRFATQNPSFAEAQEALYFGRIDRLEAQAARLSRRSVGDAQLATR